MRLKTVLLFGVVIASLTFVAIAGDVKELELKFKGDGYFGQRTEIVGGEVLLVFFPAVEGEHVPDSLNVSHLGLSEVDWEIRVTAPIPPDPGFEFVDGWFTITGANGSDSLEGIYTGFVLTFTSPTTGSYDLEWLFTGGTDKFEGATGTGHTDGLVDFGPPPYAKFEFSGEVTVPE